MTTAIRKHALEPVLSGLERKENFEVLVIAHTAVAMDQSPHADNSVLFDAVVTGDYCTVPELDMNGVAVTSNIMAQTVALDSYADTVDDLLSNFAKNNSTVTKRGSFSATDKSDLFKTVAHNNSIFIDMISKIRIKDRSNTAWNLTKYETISVLPHFRTPQYQESR